MTNQASRDRATALQFQKEPPRDRLADRKAKFEALNRLVTKRHGWLTSVPGAIDVALETLPESGLPDELRALGYDVVEDGTGERILACGITEHIPVTEGSSITRRVQHAGVTRVHRWVFSID